ncbi:hypothetical protein CcCBS67573_g02607 [Chytriomyces confervae]|uniref:Clu domain-containing protein n=1 Tax=Chytriomyces confervae TaxID=246404 RepID=A0A507FII5_9FUNG|nr:Intracellular distribution of mitochondria [Chytriomyces hyalinus]TPX76113.1 hypothetical protein CcCBS67573_g02607 [Chytriomyces confervae]
MTEAEETVPETQQEEQTTGATAVVLSISLPSSGGAFKVAVPLTTSIGDIRTHIIDSPEGQFNTCFYLALRGARILDVATVGELEEFDPETDSLEMVPDEFNDREVRIQIARMREILTAFRSSTTSQVGLDVGVSYLQDVSGDFDINPQVSSKEGDAEKKITSNNSNGTHPFINYDFDLSQGFEQTSNLIPSSKEVAGNDCLKSLSISSWNPPPPHRRTAGDIMYLAVMTNEGTTHHITCSVNGFHVSRSTNSHFDPTLKNFHGSTLPSVLSQLSPSFKSKFSALHKSIQRRHPHTYLLPSVEQSTPWIVKEPKYAPDSSRTLDSLIAAADNADILATRDWNEEFCGATALPVSTHSERVVRSQTLHRVYNEFVDAATRGVAAIVQKSLPGNIGGVAEEDAYMGQMFLHGGIFYAFAKDQGESFTRTGGSAAAHVSVSKDVNSLAKFDSVCGGVAGINVNTLGTCVVDYKGVRVVAQTVIPGILKRQQSPAVEESETDEEKPAAAAAESSDVIVYGSIDSGRTILSSPEFHTVAEKFSTLLRLESHNATDADGNVHTLATPIDVKGIIGTDGRKYLLDLARLAPVDVEFLDQLDKDGKDMPAYPHRMTLLRHELVDMYFEHNLGKYINEKRAEEEKKKAEGAAAGQETVDEDSKAVEPLNIKFNPDAFALPAEVEGEETPELLKQKENVRAVGKFLVDTVIPTMAMDMAAHPSTVPLTSEKLTKFLHERGINMRYLGKMVQTLEALKVGSSSNYAKELMVQEMILRAAKAVLRELLQDLPLHMSTECVAHFLNCLFAGKDGNVSITKPRNVTKDFSFYSLTAASLDERIRTEIETRFRYPSNLLPEFLAASRRVPLLRALCLKVGIQLKSKQYELSKTPAFAVADVLNLYPIVKYAEPGCSFGDELHEHALFTLRKGDQKVGLEFLSEALNVYEQVFGPVHADAAKIQRQLAVHHYETQDHELCKIYQRRALLITERLNGFDDPETLQQYLNLGYFECLSGNTLVGFKYMHHAMKLLKMHCAEARHPELAAGDAQVAMLLNESKVDTETGVKFLARAVETYDILLGREHEQTIRAHELYFNSLIQSGDFVKALEVQEILLTYAKSKSTEEDEASKKNVQEAEQLLVMLRRKIEMDAAEAASSNKASNPAAQAAPKPAAASLPKKPVSASKLKSKNGQQAPLSKAAAKQSRADSAASAALAAGPVEPVVPSKGHLPIDELVKFIEGGSSKGAKKGNKKGKN